MVKFYLPQPRYVLLLLLITLGTLATHAALVSVTNAQTVALNFFKTTSAAHGHITFTASLKFTQTDSDGTVDFYAFDIQPAHGFVIVAAEDNVMPVLAYSTETNFPLSFSQFGLADWISKTAQQVHQTVLHQLQVDGRISTLWSSYQQGITPPSIRSSPVAPLLSTTWDQAPYYNQDCPVLPSDGQLCITGCVATAMSQIMKYWNYPPQGYGSFNYVDNQANGYSNNIGPLSANFGTTTYLWTQMPAYLTGANNAVATLMSNAGISVAMDYGVGGSGAYVLQDEADAAYGETNAPCAQHSYPDYFLYNPLTIQGVYQSSYSPSDWLTIIDNELNSGRPVEYQGADPGVGGHTWVCDGYDANNYLHMNWGWSGQADGYYAINNLSPGGYDFSENDAALIGIEPPDSVHQPCSAQAAFSYQNISGFTVQFSNNSSSQNGYTSNWTFSNSQGSFSTSSTTNPLVTFTGSAPFSATLIITDSVYFSCHDTFTLSLTPNAYCVSLQPSWSLDSNAIIGSIWPDSVYNLLGGHGANILPYIAADEWTYSGTPGEKRALLKFNLTAIPAGATITYATLSLYADDSTEDGYLNQPTYGTENACYLQRVTSSWNAMNVTWNNQPATDTTNEAFLNQATGTSQNYIGIDITAFVKEWMNHPDSNYGIRLKMLTQNYYNSLIFCSSNFWDSTRRPKLDICYIPAPCNNTASFTYTNTTGTTVQFTNTSTSPNGYSSSWAFYNALGQIGTSTLQNPLVIYTGQPPYSATLVINDLSHGCTDTITKTVTLNVAPVCVTLQGDSSQTTTAYIFSGAPTSNVYGSPDFGALQWTWSGVPGEMRGLIKFNLSAIPANASILSASLSLFAFDTIGLNDHLNEATYGSNNASYLQEITSPWAENTVTWSNAPTTATTGEQTLAQSTGYTENYTNIDITSFVQSWLQNPSGNYGMMLREITSQYYNCMIFCSPTYWDSTLWPKLQICYIPSSCNETASFVYTNTAGHAVQFTNTSLPYNGYTSSWTFYNGQGQFGTSTVQNPLVNFTGLPPYSATLAITDNLSATCTDTVTENIIFNSDTACGTLIASLTFDSATIIAQNNPDSSGSGNSPEQEFFASHWTYQGTPGEVRGLIKFNLSVIPAGSTILSAHLSLYANDSSSNGYSNEPTYGTDNASYFEQITSPWNYTSVTWNNQPSITAANEVLLPQSTSYTENYLNMDVTQFVENWVQNPGSNYGMMLKMIGSNFYNSLIFCSGDYPDSTKRPQLNICYLSAGPCPDSAFFSWQNTGGTTVQFTNHSLAADGYLSQWTFYNSQGAFATTAVKNPVINFIGSPPFSAKLVITDSLSATCVDSLTQSITIGGNLNCVVVQPSFTLDSTAEFFSLLPDSNYNRWGGGHTAQAWMSASHWTWDGTPGETRALFRFNLSGFIPAGAIVESAELSLYANDSTTEGPVGDPTYGSNNACYLQRVTSPWGAIAVDWATQPTVDTTGEVLMPQAASYSQNYPGLDVTNFVQGWVANPASNYGLRMYMITQNYYNCMIICSSAFWDSTRRPSLDICYTVPTCNDSASFTYINTQGVAVQFTNTSTASDGYISHWTFYNSQGVFATSTAQNPFVNFVGQPPYYATLVITDSLLAGCGDSVTQSIDVRTGPGCLILQPFWSIDSDAVVGSIIPDSVYNLLGGIGPNPIPYFAADEWTYGGVPGEKRGFLKFNLGSIPSGAVITSAALSLYGADSVTGEGYEGQPTYGTNNSSYLQRVTSPWDAMKITWNNQPSADTAGELFLATATNPFENYTGMDLTNFVRLWVSHPDSNFGLRLILATPNYYNSMAFASSHHWDSTSRPRLDVCYTISTPCSDTAYFLYQFDSANTVQFINNSIAPNGYASYWTFYNASGPFATSTAQNPLVTFTGSQPYSATLTITDSLSASCKDSTTQVINVQNACTLPVTVTAQSTGCASDSGSASVTPLAGSAPYRYQWGNGATIASISNLAGGVYPVTVSDANGCSAIDTAIVQGTMLQSITIKADTTTICPNQTTRICAPAGYLSYAWNTGQDSSCIETSQAGDYYVTVSEGVNCTTTSNHIQVTVLSSPSVSVSQTGDTLACYNGIAYQWYFNNVPIPNSDSSIYIARSTGDYSVVLTDSEGCQATSNVLFVTGISSIDLDGTISVYPNPLNQGNWILEVSANLVGSKAEVYDSKGSLVSSFGIEDLKTKMELTPESGIYALRVISGTSIYIRKLVKL